MRLDNPLMSGVGTFLNLVLFIPARADSTVRFRHVARTLILTTMNINRTRGEPCLYQWEIICTLHWTCCFDQYI